MSEPHDPPPRTEAEVPANPDYSPRELNKNRVTIAAVTLAFIVACWVYCWNGTLDVGGATVLTVIALFTAAIFVWLFAAKGSTKVDENSAGSGKTVKPRTMGTLLGYLYDGFK